MTEKQDKGFVIEWRHRWKSSFSPEVWNRQGHEIMPVQVYKIREKAEQAMKNLEIMTGCDWYGDLKDAVYEYRVKEM